MLRSKELEEIKELIKRRKSVLLVGKNGIGKTWLLSHLNGIYVEYPGRKLILETIIKELGIETERSPRYLSVAELLDIARPNLKKVVLLLDEIQEARKPTLRFIDKIISEGACTVLASERRVYLKRINEVIEIKPLDRFDSELLVYKSLGRVIPRLPKDIIVSKSKGNPGKIIQLCEAYKMATKFGDVNEKDDNSVLKFFAKEKPEFSETIDLLPGEYLFAVGFGLLIVKYIFFDKGDLRTAYFLGGLGYLTLIIWRSLKYKGRH